LKTLDIDDIAADLQRAAKDYLVDACRDRLTGKVREWFEEDLSQRGLSGVAEIAEPAAVFVDSNPGGGGTAVTTIGSTVYDIDRIVTPVSSVDVAELRRDGGARKLLDTVRDDVRTYVDTLPQSTTVASVPALHVSVRAYMAEWFLWGYCGTPRD